MLTKALLVGNFKAAVDICIRTERMVRVCVIVTTFSSSSLLLSFKSEALILSVAGGSELFQSTQKQFFDSKKSDSTKVCCDTYHFIFSLSLPQLISLITSRKWSDIAQYGNLANWREILATLVTYSTSEDFTKLCGMVATVTSPTFSFIFRRPR